MPRGVYDRKNAKKKTDKVPPRVAAKRAPPMPDGSTLGLQAELVATKAERETLRKEVRRLELLVVRLSEKLL